MWNIVANMYKSKVSTSSIIISKPAKCSIDYLRQCRRENVLLHYAANGKIEMVKFLVEQGVNQKSRNDALKLANTNGHKDTAAYLIIKGAILN
jgi:hypothetical protein